MKGILILVSLLIQIFFLNLVFSQNLHADMNVTEAISQLTDNGIYQSPPDQISNNSKTMATLPGKFNQSETKTDTPSYKTVLSYSVKIPPSDDPADIFYPDQSDSMEGIHKLPFALLMQGANVDKSFYSGFARTVAGFGFIVVVPNQKSTMIIATGLYAQENKVNDVLSFMRSENNRSNSPLNQKIDTNTMVLLGHSYGGVASLYAIQGSCQYPFCIGFAFHRPDALKGGAFYGTNLKGPIGPIPALDNHGLPICLIQGSRDSLATPAETEETYYGIKDSPKAYIIVKGANHYGITDLNNPPGAKPDKNVPLISQQEAVEIIGRVAALFLHDYALSDENA